MKITGVPGSQTLSLVILCLASLGVSGSLFRKKPLLHRAVILALEDILLLSIMASHEQISADGVRRFEDLSKNFIVHCTDAFSSVFKGRKGKNGIKTKGTIARPKIGSLSHYVSNVAVDGTSVHINCGATETAGKDVRYAYQKSNKKGVFFYVLIKLYKLNIKHVNCGPSRGIGDLGGWLMSFLHLRHFIQAWLPVLLRQPDAESLDDGPQETFYRTRDDKGMRVETHHPLHLLLKTSMKAWLNANVDLVPHNHIFSMDRLFRKDRARVSKPNFMDCFIVASESHQSGHGDGMASAEASARYDSVDLSGFPETHATFQLRMIFTYKFHDRTLGADTDKELDFIFVQGMSAPLAANPFRVFDFKRLVKQYAVYELSTIVRTRWVLKNFTSKPIATSNTEKFDHLSHDGYLIWKY